MEREFIDLDQLDAERFTEIYDVLVSRPATPRMVLVCTPYGRSWVYEKFMEGKCCR